MPYTTKGILEQIQANQSAAINERILKSLENIEYKIPKCENFIDANGTQCKRFVPEMPDYLINIQAPKIFNPDIHSFCIDTAAPDNAEIHISVSRRKNIKFNFKN